MLTDPYLKVRECSIFLLIKSFRAVCSLLPTFDMF